MTLCMEFRDKHPKAPPPETWLRGYCPAVLLTLVLLEGTQSWQKQVKSRVPCRVVCEPDQSPWSPIGFPVSAPGGVWERMQPLEEIRQHRVWLVSVWVGLDGYLDGMILIMLC